MKMHIRNEISRWLDNKKYVHVVDGFIVRLRISYAHTKWQILPITAEVINCFPKRKTVFEVKIIHRSAIGVYYLI